MSIKKYAYRDHYQVPREVRVTETKVDKVCHLLNENFLSVNILFDIRKI